MVQDEQEKWDIVIKPRSGLFRLDLEEVWLYRDLLVMYIRRDIVTFYKQTVLGPLWFVIQPLLTTVMFMFVFGGIAGIPTDGLPQPLFYMAGLLCWNYFSECLSRCSDTFNANQNVFGKVYFPRLVVPLSIVISCMIKMGIQFGLFVLIYIYYLCNGYSLMVNGYAWLAPLLLLMLAGLGLGFGCQGRSRSHLWLWLSSAAPQKLCKCAQLLWSGAYFHHLQPRPNEYDSSWHSLPQFQYLQR